MSDLSAEKTRNSFVFIAPTERNRNSTWRLIFSFGIRKPAFKQITIQILSLRFVYTSCNSFKKSVLPIKIILNFSGNSSFDCLFESQRVPASWGTFAPLFYWPLTIFFNPLPPSGAVRKRKKNIGRGYSPSAQIHLNARNAFSMWDDLNAWNPP